MTLPTPFSADGSAATDPVRTRVTWRQLQLHAAFPADGTAVTQEAIHTPLGELRCRRYDVGGMVVWFDTGRPVCPMRRAGCHADDDQRLS